MYCLIAIGAAADYFKSPVHVQYAGLGLPNHLMIIRNHNLYHDTYVILEIVDAAIYVPCQNFRQSSDI